MLLEVDGLTSPLPGSFRDVSFRLHRGEVLGIGGLVGAQRTELVEAIFGLRAIASGTIRVNGREEVIRSPIDAKRLGMALLTEDRRDTGVVPTRSVFENVILAHMPRYANRLGIVDTGAARDDARRVLGRLRVRTPSLQTPITNLSGGNQQKVLLGRWLLWDPEILILDEPTRGIDVGAKFEIYTIINELAAQGKGIIMISSELPELIGESDRIVVMCRGRLTGIVDRAQADEATIMRLATDVEPSPRPSSRWPPMSERPPPLSGHAPSTATADGTDARARRWRAGRPTRSGLGEWVSANAILVVLLVLILGIALYDPDFISANSVRNILTNSSTRLLVALGAGIVLISRGVDLSGGRMVGLAAVVSASMLQSETYSRLFFPDLPALPLILPILVAVARHDVPRRHQRRRRRQAPRAAVHRHAGDDGHRLRHDGHLLRPAAQQLPAHLRDPRRPLVPGHRRADRWVPCRSRSSSPSPARRRSSSGCCCRRRSSARTSTPSAATRRRRRCRASTSCARSSRSTPSRAPATASPACSRRHARVERRAATASSTSSMPSLPASSAACRPRAASGRVRGIVAGVLVFSVISYGLTFIGINPFWQQIIKGVIIISAVAFDMARSRSRR